MSTTNSAGFETGSTDLSVTATFSLLLTVPVSMWILSLCFDMYGQYINSWVSVDGILAFTFLLLVMVGVGIYRLFRAIAATVVRFSHWKISLVMIIVVAVVAYYSMLFIYQDQVMDWIRVSNQCDGISQCYSGDSFFGAITSILVISFLPVFLALLSVCGLYEERAPRSV